MSTTADVNHIFKTISAITNKEQKGYVKPSEFNTLLQQAELEVFEENYFKGIVPNKIQRGVESDPQRTDALIPYIRTASGMGVGYVLPADYMHMLGVYSGSYQVKFTRHSELSKRLRSEITPPSLYDPLYTIAASVDGSTPITQLNFYTHATGPNAIVYKVVYLCKPSVPALGHYVVQTGTGLFDASTSTALDVPKSEHSKIMNKVLQYLGVHLKDSDVVNFATNELTNQ